MRERQCKITGRDQWQKMQAVRHPAPPLGIYNPKIVKKNVPVLFNHDLEMKKTGTRTQETASIILDERYTHEMGKMFYIIIRNQP